MERLTQRLENGWSYCAVDCPEYRDDCECEHLHKMIDKLAGYEELEEVNEQAKDLVTIRASVCLEIKDAAIYGGTGSVGYAEYAMTGNGKMLSMNIQRYADEIKADFAKRLNVPEGCIRIISEEEYKAHTEDEEAEHE